jgi:hypothetical protein
MRSGGQEGKMSRVNGKPKPRSAATERLIYRLIVAHCVFFVVSLNSKSIAAQIPDAPLPVDPRSLTQLISGSEKSMLAEANNPKKLVDAYLKISDTRLQSAFNAIKVNNNLGAENELDIYNKAVAAACKEAFAVQDGKRALSKRIEQALYKQIKTLETIERLFPSEREMFAEAALKQSKQLRVQALNEAFASGEVLKDPEEEKKPKSEPPIKDGFANRKNPVTLGPLQPPVESYVASQKTPSFLRSLIWTAVSTRQPVVLTGSGVAFAGTAPASFRLEFRRALPTVRAIYSVAGSGVDSMQMRGDYLTEEEDEHVREAQAADVRAKVFMKIADRRLKAMVGPAPSPTDKKDQKKIEEEEREWGAVPKISRVELLRHYARAISECMAKLEDAYERNPKSSALPKALTVLREATDKHLQTLQTLKAEMKTETEIAAISGAIYEAETANKGARDGLK